MNLNEQTMQALKDFSITGSKELHIKNLEYVRDLLGEVNELSPSEKLDDIRLTILQLTELVNDLDIYFESAVAPNKAI